MTSDTCSYETLAVERRGAADWLTLNRPARLNAFTFDMADELRAYFEALRGEPGVRVVVMRGAGKAFCAGIDIKDTIIDQLDDPDAVLAYQQHFSGVVTAMRRCPQPIVALVHGAATGGGLSLALAADIRIAGRGARMNAAYIRVGLSGSDMGSSYFLPRLVGLSNAAEILMSGRFVDAERALRIGLVSEVVDDDALEQAGTALVEDMLAASPLGLRATKAALAANVEADLEGAIALEDRNQAMCALGDEVRERLARFRRGRAG